MDSFYSLGVNGQKTLVLQRKINTMQYCLTFSKQYATLTIGGLIRFFVQRRQKQQSSGGYT